MCIRDSSYLIHIAFAASMGEPPQIATIQSGWNFSIAAAPFMTVSTDGSGSMPSNSSTSIPASFKYASAPVSYTHLDVYKRQMLYCTVHETFHVMAAWIEIEGVLINELV